MIIPLYSVLVRIHRDCGIVLVPVLVHTIQKGHGQIGESQMKGCDDQKTGEPVQ